MRKLDWVIIIIILETCGVENRAVSLPPPPKNRKNIFFFLLKGDNPVLASHVKFVHLSQKTTLMEGEKKKKSSCCKIIVFSFFYFFLLYYLSNFSIYFNRK